MRRHADGTLGDLGAAMPRKRWKTPRPSIDGPVIQAVLSMLASGPKTRTELASIAPERKVQAALRVAREAGLIRLFSRGARSSTGTQSLYELIPGGER